MNLLSDVFIIDYDFNRLFSSGTLSIFSRIYEDFI